MHVVLQDGKTTYIAELMKNEGRVDAWDIHEHRVKLVEEAASKLGINIIKACKRDASEYLSEYSGRYDKILLDVPCSGIGVIRKKPDIKWTRNIEDIDEMCEIQAKILDTCSEYLRPGGKLVYSTCTVFKRENDDQIKKFLQKHIEYELEEEIHLYPHINETDGFFIAVLKKL